MTNLGKILTGVVVLAALAAVIVALLSKPKRRNLMAIYHLNKDGAFYGNYEHLGDLKDALFYPVDFGQYIRWEAIKDEYEEGPKFVPGWDVEVGKDGFGLYHKNPYESGTRVGVSSPEENGDWLSTL